MTSDATLPPSPQGGWSQSVITLRNALVVPPVEAKTLVLKTGVFDESGAYCPQAAMWRRDVAITEPPKAGTPQEQFEGKWLWGGVLYHHFGHFQVESIARLWAVKRYRDEISGIVFVSRDVKADAAVLPYELEYLKLLVGDVPIRLVIRPSRVEELIVPGQGFGLGKIAAGTRVFRRFIDQQFAQDVAAEGPEKLFISRSKQGLNQGGFVGEEVLDARMEAAGYTVFFPEEHDITTQVARYKAASQVVALDGSALHLFAMVGKKRQAVAIILRRERVASRSMRRHLHRFMARKPLAINALGKSGEATQGKKRMIDELDFELIGKLLKRHGFLAKAQDWGALSVKELS